MDAKNSNPGTNAKAAGGMRSPLIYVAILAAVLAVMALAYYEFSGASGTGLTSNQVLNNVSGSNLNATQALFINDLRQSANITNMHVSYYFGNSINYITAPGNHTIAVTSNQTLDSYKFGSYNKSVFSSVVTYADSQNGSTIAKNISKVYYYNTNTMLTCFNYTSYLSNSVTNSSLSCSHGDNGFSYLEVTPYTIANVTPLALLVFNNSVSYSGVKDVFGRNCDYFAISNVTSANTRSNYSVIDICLDKQYGFPLFLNETLVSAGLPNSFSLTADLVSTNVSQSEFVVPQRYINATQQAI
ncbi:MAG: hypothetical protein KGH72_03050 [Candidatus Micrarchaeota archaeon]|nr:hypothetical protein [Candidatus Micrarchaeota archaeon]